MSRARIVCSEILSRMSPVHHLDDKVYPNSNTAQDKVFNLCFNECSNGENTDVSSVLSEINTSMDDWLRQKTTCTSMDCIDSAYLNDINFLSTRDPDMCSSDIGLELILVNNEKKESNLNYCTLNDKNSDLDYTDPLLNLVPMNEVLLRKTETKCDNILGGKDLYASDGEISLNKGRPVWDTLSIASRKSDCDVENNNDFADFNLLPLSFDTNDHINALDPLVESNIHVKNQSGVKIPSLCPTLASKSDSNDVTSTLVSLSPIPENTEYISTMKGVNKQSLISPIQMPTPRNKKLISIKRPNILRTVKHKTRSSDSNAIDKNMNTLNKSVFDLTNDEFLTLLPETNEMKNAVAEMTGSVAVVSSLVGKTRIAIRTAQGVERYEGNTSELTETLVAGEHIVTSVRTATATATTTASSESEDRLVRDMLAVLGISDDMLYSIGFGTSSNMRLWLCPEHECRRIFNRLNTLKAHILSHYGLKPFKCDFPNCPWSFYTSFKLKRHRETHLKRKDFTCTVADCNRSFTTVYNLNTHLKLHERPARLKCLVRSCTSRFQTRRAMELHLKTHELALAPYRCVAANCAKPYFSLGALTAHMRVHQHKEEELRCQWENCGRRFDKPCRLKAHMRVHTGDKPYVCRYQDCHWAFASSSKLKRHQYKHNNERRFRCTIGDCTKAFMRSEHLREHTFTHIAQRTFQCPICGEKCSAKATLYVHKKKFHPNETCNNKVPGINHIQKPTNENTTLLIALEQNTGPVVIQEYEVNLDNPSIPTSISSNTITSTSSKPRGLRKPKAKTNKSCARTYMPYSDIRTTSDLDIQTIVLGNSVEDVLLNNSQQNHNENQNQTIYFSDLMLQDATDATDDTAAVAVTGDMYAQEDGAEYILLFDSGTSTSFPESTVNLKDLD